MSREALGGVGRDDAPGPAATDPVDVGVEVDGRAAADDPGPAEHDGVRRRRVLLVATAAALLLTGFLVGQRAGTPGSSATARGAPAPSSTASSSPAPRPNGYAVTLPDEEDLRASRVVVSWTGARELGTDRQLVVAVVVDDRTRVVGTRLADRGALDVGTGAGTPDEGLLPAEEGVARAVLERAGEDVEAQRGTVVTAVRGRASGVLVVDLREDAPDLGVVTAPRVHLAVVEGTRVVHLLALPVGGRRALP